MATPKSNEKDKTAPVGVKSVPMEVFDKLQAIAGIERLTFQEIYNLAFVKFIEAYEAKNGKLKLKPKGKGLEGL